MLRALGRGPGGRAEDARQGVRRDPHAGGRGDDVGGGREQVGDEWGGVDCEGGEGGAGAECESAFGGGDEEGAAGHDDAVVYGLLREFGVGDA